VDRATAEGEPARCPDILERPRGEAVSGRHRPGHSCYHPGEPRRSLVTSLPADFPRRKLILELSRRLAEHPAVRRVWLFGSRARGDNFERSDIDFAIEAPGIDRGQWAALHLDLEEDADTLLLVDFVLMDDLPETFRRRVHREGRLLYERGNSPGLHGELGQGAGPLR
jgi:predicted nucleotidyltransferase